MLSEQPTYRVYLLYDKRYPDDFWKYREYIGYTKKTVEERIRDHFSEAKHSKANTKKLNWLRKIGKENIAYKIMADDIPTLEEALKKEVEVIAKLKQCGHISHLKNGDNGGYGGTKNYTAETIEKLRKSKVGNSWNKGRKRPKEFGEAISRALTGRTYTSEHVAKGVETRRKNKEAGLQKERKSTFSELQVIEIFRLFNSESTAKQISEQFSCKKSTISAVLYHPGTYSKFKQRNNLKPTRV